LTIGSSELTVIASDNLPEQGERTSPPVSVSWRWYYHLPGVAFWALALPLFGVVKENRHRQAWTILIALLVIVIVSRMLPTLFSADPGPAEFLSTFLTTFATGWTMVWLLGPWLGGVRGVMAFIIALAVMYFVGLLSYMTCFGLAYGQNLPALATCYTLATFGLLLPMVLTRHSCRRGYSRSRFMGWLLFWMEVAMVVGMLLLDVAMALIDTVPGRAPAELFIGALPSVLLVGAVSGVVLYLVNLPFMVLAFRTDLYGKRFCHVLRLARPAGQE
jgi:hypothetical protein